MPRFDVYANPNPRASHARLLDVQSDLVQTSTRWCVPMMPAAAGLLVIAGAQALVDLEGQPWLLDTPNILAVPMALLLTKQGHLPSDGRLQVEAALDFMLRGY